MGIPVWFSAGADRGLKKRFFIEHPAAFTTPEFINVNNNIDHFKKGISLRPGNIIGATIRATM